MTGIERFEDLKSWQEARKLEQLVYRVTAKDAFRQDRALRWQLQDAAVAAMGNIAESHGRYSFEDKRRFLDIALGSSREAQSHLYVALDQAYVDRAEFDQAYRQAEIVAALVSGAIKNLDLQIERRIAGQKGPRHGPRPSRASS